LGTASDAKIKAVRATFLLWIAVIAIGIVFFAIVGLSHR
jgi:hypothetical protein